MSNAVLASMVFVAVMVLIISEKVHRTVAAICGAVLLLVFKVMTFEEGISYVDFNTLGILSGMMLFVAVIKNSGLFEYMAVKVARMSGGSPLRLMSLFIIVTAALSSVLDNVTTILLIAPMTIIIANILRMDPVPLLITQVIASNIGGTATLIGDPPNIMIGSAAGLTFMDFLQNNGLIVMAVLIAITLCFRIIYGRNFAAHGIYMKNITSMDERSFIKDEKLMRKSLLMIVMTVTAFVFHDRLGIDTAVIALTAAGIMMVVGKQDIREVILDVEWSTILFFAGLFVVVGGLVHTGIIGMCADMITVLAKGDTMTAMIIILWMSALLSSTLDNIPFVATMIPLIFSMGESGMEVMPLWWALSLGACLGGNGTLIGASANVVASSISGKNGHPITYMKFFKTGFPLMILSVLMCSVYLILRYM